MQKNFNAMTSSQGITCCSLADYVWEEALYLYVTTSVFAVDELGIET